LGWLIYEMVMLIREMREYKKGGGINPFPYGSASHVDNIQSIISRFVKTVEKKVKLTTGWGHFLAKYVVPHRYLGKGLQFDDDFLLF